MKKQGIIKFLKDNRSQLEAYGVHRIGLFGSYARGEEEGKSDIDFLVEFKPGKKTFDNYMDLKLYLEGVFGAKADLVIKETVKPKLRTHILREVIYA